MKKITFIFITVLILSTGCKKKDDSVENITGIWNIDKLKIEDIYVDPDTENDVLVQLILESDFYGEWTWYDFGSYVSDEVFTWNINGNHLEINIGGLEPLFYEFIYSLENDQLHIIDGDRETIYDKEVD